MKPSENLVHLLMTVREHPAFSELLSIVEAPKLPLFRASKSETFEAETMKWIHQSGRVQQHNAWIAVLAGKQIPPEAE